MNAVNSVIEDYLKVVYAHTEWQSKPITPGAIAARLGLAASTVTEMVKKLVAQGLLRHEPYGAIELTDAGRDLALRMVRRHRLIETWLVQHVGYRWDEVHDEAEVLEHAMSDRLLDALDAQLGHPTRDPHGDPIPTADGTIARLDATLLADCDGGVVVRISDRDPLLLRHLQASGVALDSRVERSTGGLRIDGVEVEVSDEALRSIWVGQSSGGATGSGSRSASAAASSARSANSSASS